MWIVYYCMIMISVQSNCIFFFFCMFVCLLGCILYLLFYCCKVIEDCIKNRMISLLMKHCEKDPKVKATLTDDYITKSLKHHNYDVIKSYQVR